jgi:uncharacterized membrane protein YjjP (DUF1212 family)
MVRNILAFFAGLVIGSLVNGLLIGVSSSVIAPPAGADVTTYEGLKASMHLFEPKHFVFPFLAHALGTFVGALASALIAASNKMKLAIAVGVLFLIGGIINVVLLPAPLWFSVLDLVAAYIPMAYLGAIIGGAKRS